MTKGDNLSLTMLFIRNTTKHDLRSTKIVYKTTLTLPGQFLTETQNSKLQGHLFMK